MDKKSKILFSAFALLIIASVGATYYRIYIKKDYIIEAQVDCDPATEKCFVWECTPDADDETERCTGDSEKDSWNYKILKRSAKYIPLCDPQEDACTAYICGENEPECEYLFCDDKTKTEQGVECSEPVSEEETTTTDSETIENETSDTSEISSTTTEESESIVAPE